ncbi:MAG: hypothetical protein IKY94_09615 [Lachnospiraceae bacterium]|nr:hypothetical protein [Lachnospiraceae bacterium]
MKKKGTWEQKNIINIVLMVLILFIGIVFVYVNLVQYKAGLNADIASEGLLAKVIWESKEWIPSEWYFSTEARLISVANCAALFYGMTKNICLSMGLAVIVAGMFVLAGLWYLGKELSFTLTQKLLMILSVMILPNNGVMLELIFVRAGHYAFHIGLYFFTLAIYLKMLKKVKVRKLEIVINLLLHLVIGIQGSRGILMITGPLLAVEFVRHIYLWWSKQKVKREDIFVGCFVIVTNVVGYLGGKIPLSVKLPISKHIRNAPRKVIEDVIPNFLSAFSWEGISRVEKIVYIACLAVVVYLVIDIVVKGMKRKEIGVEKWIFLNFFASVTLTAMAVAFSTMGSSNRYYVAIYFAIAMGISILIGSDNKFIKSGLMLITCILFVINCYKFYYPMLMKQDYKQDIYAQVGEYLIQEEYEYAYGEFKSANTITVYSDGKIQVSAVDSFTDMSICKWLTSKKWYVPNVPKESKTAYVVPECRLAEMEEFLNSHSGSVQFETKIGDQYIYSSDYNYSKLTD